MFQATKRGVRSLAVGLMLMPLLGSVQGRVYAQVPKPATPAVASTATGSTEQARGLLKQAREAMQAGEFTKARTLTMQAKSLNAPMGFWDDTPEKLLAELDKKAPAKTVGSAQGGQSDPRAMLKAGRDAFSANKLDEAREWANKANAAGGRWGLFEDSPAKLLDDIRKVQAKMNRAKADQIMVDARKALDKGDLDTAEKLTYTAENLHGPYGFFDGGDRPDRMRSEIAALRSKAQKPSVPPPSGLAKKDSKPADKAALPASGVATAKPTSPSPLWPEGGKSPATAKADVSPAMPRPSLTIVSPTKEEAMALVAAGRKLQAEGQFSAAREKYNEAAKLRARFEPGEDSPEMAMASCMADCQKQLALLMDAGSQATLQGDNSKADAAFAKAKTLAKEMGLDAGLIDERIAKLRTPSMPTTPAASVAMTPAPTMPTSAPMPDMQAVNLPVGGAAAMPAPAGPAVVTASTPNMPSMSTAVVPAAAATPAPAPTAPTTPAVPAVNPGIEMMSKARLELRRGETETARRLAIEVYNGPYGMKDESEALLRSIEAEEFNQRRLSAVKSYEAVLAAYNSRDVNMALAIAGQIDADMLPADKKASLDAMIAGIHASIQASRVTTTTTTPMPSAAPTPQVQTAMLPATPVVPPTQAAMVTPAGVAPTATPAVANMPASSVPMPVAVTVPTKDTEVVPVSAPGGPAAANTPPGGNDSLAKQVLALQEIDFQRLRDEGLKVQRDATAKFSKGETDAAIDMIQEYLNKLKDSQLEPSKVAMLRRSAESRLSRFKMLKIQQDFESSLTSRKKEFRDNRTQAVAAEEHKVKQIKELMKEYNDLLTNGKYREAEVVAMRAQELDTDNPSLGVAVHTARTNARLAEYKEIKGEREKQFVEVLNDSERTGPALTSKKPLHIDKERTLNANSREAMAKGLTLGGRSPKEREIERKMMAPITGVDFKAAPLSQVINDLHMMTGINIVPDMAALEEEGISLSKPITVKLDNVSLKSALEVILKQAHLTHVVRSEVLQVTTERHARGQLVRKTYCVADLVIPVDNFYTPETMNLQNALARSTGVNQNVSLNGATPFNGQMSLTNGTPTGNPSLTNSGAMVPVGKTAMERQAYVAQNRTMEDMLIKLITNTIAPQSWADVGGAGTIDYYPLGMALVINQTADVQEQVSELLDALRRLQDLEVAVEVKIVTLAETFFERIGLDFNLNVKTDSSTQKIESVFTTGVAKPDPFLNDLRTKGVIAGLTPAGSFTRDLDIPIRASSFNSAIPPFAFPNMPGANGGLSMGLAFLNDIQVFMFMEAAQGDRRTNVMQAPKLTLFNGQSATINIVDQQFFVTNVTVVSANGQIVFVPTNQPFPVGVQLAMQAVVSADRRFVRLNINPTLNNLASAVVPLFPITTFITPIFEGGAQGQPIPFTQFIQQPQFNTIAIQTSVSVPDGGTVLLGGLKSFSEGRNEFGPPVLSKVPYVNRLFKNVGYGKEAQSVLIMVTPRIIINTEEEERQTGNVANTALAP